MFYFLSQYDFKQNSKHKNDIKIIVLLYAKLSDILSVDKYIKIIQRGRDKSEIKQKPAQFLNRHNNYSIRKFTIGTASILVGTTLILV